MFRAGQKVRATHPRYPENMGVEGVVVSSGVRDTYIKITRPCKSRWFLGQKVGFETHRLQAIGGFASWFREHSHG